jgi:Endonuclease NucS
MHMAQGGLWPRSGAHKRSRIGEEASMAIFQVTKTELKPLGQTSFGAENIMERNDLQRLLRDQIAVLDDGFMVIAEEFGDWVDSSRRIDLLCIDSNANLVVVELKRTEDGGHMDLQALRYAAMISTMTFEQLVDVHARFKNKAQPETSTARAAILEFLGWEEEDQAPFAQDTRIVLAAADFSKELTTAVMWLNDHGGRHHMRASEALSDGGWRNPPRCSTIDPAARG